MGNIERYIVDGKMQDVGSRLKARNWLSVIVNNQWLLDFCLWLFSHAKKNPARGRVPYSQNRTRK